MTDDAKKTESQADIARRALDAKNEAGAPHHPEAGRSANEGMILNEGSARAPSGAFDAEGQRPVLERSRKAR